MGTHYYCSSNFGQTTSSLKLDALCDSKERPHQNIFYRPRGVPPLFFQGQRGGIVFRGSGASLRNDFPLDPPGGYPLNFLILSGEEERAPGGYQKSHRA